MSTKPAICLYSPYEWCETTHMAVHLADYVARAGYGVIWIPTSFEPTDRDDDPGLYPAWDASVQRAWRRESKVLFAPALARRITTMVYLTWPNENFRIRPALSGARHILVFSPHTLPALSRQTLPTGFDTIVCPSGETFRWASRFGPQFDNRCIPWDSGYGYSDDVPRRTWTDPRLLVVVDEAAAASCGEAVLGTLRRLFLRMPDLRVTLTSTRGWRPEDARCLEELLSRYADRCILTVRMSLFERRQAARTHDATWVVSGNTISGAVALEFLALGSPVIGFDAPPMSEFLIPRCNGECLPGYVEPFALRGFCPAEAAERIVDFFGQKRIPGRCLASLEQRASNWQDAWRKLLWQEDEEDV